MKLGMEEDSVTLEKLIAKISTGSPVNGSGSNNLARK
jgi:hypothetical protein